MLAKSMWNCKKGSKSQFVFLLQNPDLYVIPMKSALGSLKTFTVSCWWYGNNPFWVAAAAHTMPSLPSHSTHEECSEALASFVAVSTLAGLPNMPQSSAYKRLPPWALKQDRAWGTGRKVLPSASCDSKVQGSDDCCRLWHLNVFALSWSRDRVTHSKHAVVTVLFSDFGP